ncbi:hypothetical protein WMO79_01305 [Micrococcaceae bacterium Sec7.4]
MNAINDVIDQARKAGRFAAGQSKSLSGGTSVIRGTNAHHPGDDVGILVLDAYRDHGRHQAVEVVNGYQDGYNARAAELGTDRVDRDQIKKGIGLALPPRTTDVEEDALRGAL